MRDTIDMAREAGFTDGELAFMGDNFRRFEALVRADQWEIDAKVCDEESNDLGGVAEGPFVTDFGKHTHMSMAAGAQNCAAAIRARGNT